MQPIALLHARLRPNSILTALDEVGPYRMDDRGTWGGMPVAVLRPENLGEVQTAVAACAEAGLAIVPASGRTGLCGGAVATAHGPPCVILSLERLNRIRSVDAANFSLVAEAGCIVQNVQAAAAEAGRLFPLSWGADGSAMVGGALSTNAGGIRTLRWGNARDLVLGLEVVLPDGALFDDLRRVRKDNSGYALRHLFIGGEGTLGVITAAVLRLVPALGQRETGFLALPSPAAAVALFSRLMESGVDVIAYELMNGRCIEMVEKNGVGIRLPLPVGSPWYVLAEAAAAHPAVPLRAMLEEVLATAAEMDELTDAVIAQNEQQQAAIWRIREDFPACAQREGPTVVSDTCVPVSAIPEFCARVEAALRPRWPEGNLFQIGHAGDGNIHVSLGAPHGTSLAAWKAHAGEAEALVNAIAVELGGSFSAEHGIGQSKRHAMTSYKDPVALDLMRRVKQALDPRGLMNPGKMLP